jgi:hypothetical protein
MNDQIRNAYEIDSIIKDINERQQMINEYMNTKHLDRGKAIFKIMELRATNIEVLTVTLANQTSIPLSNASDEMLLNDLQMQIIMLRTELLKKTQG